LKGEVGDLPYETTQNMDRIGYIIISYIYILLNYQYDIGVYLKTGDANKMVVLMEKHDNEQWYCGPMFRQTHAINPMVW
jgi:hypothetical protein